MQTIVNPWYAGGMGIYSVVGLALAIAVFGVIANHAREMYRDEKYREMFGSLFWALVPLVVFSIFWVVNESPSIMGRNIFLGIIGAGLGAVALIWVGYFAHDMSTSAHAQTATGTMSTNENLASALENLASAIESAPPIIIGEQTTVTAGPGSSGTIIGRRVTVTAGPGTRGTVIGEQTTVTAGGPNGTTPVNNSVGADLRAGAASVRQGDASRSTVRALLAEAMLPGSPQSVQAALQNASRALEDSDLPQ